MVKIKERKRFSYGNSGKLVRDKTIEIALKEDPDCLFSYKYLSDHELQPHLFNKLQEEVSEVLEAKNQEQICSELADILDVIDAIKKHNFISEEALIIARKKKQELRGGFDSRLFVEWMECESSGSHSLYEYCLLNPDKYPELDPVV